MIRQSACLGRRRRAQARGGRGSATASARSATATRLPAHRFPALPNDERQNDQSCDRISPFQVPDRVDSNPAKTITDRYAHKADSAASARRAALPVLAERRRFSLASHGITAAATMRTIIPSNVGLGSLYPSRLMADARAT